MAVIKIKSFLVQLNVAALKGWLRSYPVIDNYLYLTNLSHGKAAFNSKLLPKLSF